MNSKPLSFQNPSQLAKNKAIRTKVPGRYEGYASQGLNADATLGFDKFARTALETYRDGAYVSLPTNSWREMRDFFCEKNFNKLKTEIEQKSGYPVHLQTLWERMMFTFYQTRPRSDQMDRRLLKTDPATVKSYVDEMNEAVVRYMVVETVAAQKHRIVSWKLRKGIREFPDTPIDARSRLVGSMYSLDYMLR